MIIRMIWLSLNQTIFSLLEYGKGLILDEIGDLKC